MSKIKPGVTGLFIFLNIAVYAQLAIGVKGGFQQSVPLAMRDSFSGKPGLSGSVNLYFPVHKMKDNSGNSLNFVSGIYYRGVSLSHKIESSGLNWQTLALNLGAEWGKPKLKKARFYTGFNINYVFAFGKTVLSGSTTSGTGYLNLKTENRIVPSLEVGMTFFPRPLFNFSITAVQPFVQSVNSGKPTLQGTLSFGIEYRLNNRDIRSIQSDTTPIPEKIFIKHLKAGTLYFIEEGTDSSIKIFRDSIAKYYTFSKVRYIKPNALISTLDAFRVSSDSNFIFIAKTGLIVPNSERSGTLGIIIYNYKMQNPLPYKSFYVRSLSGDSYFEDPYAVKKIIIKLNKRLFKMFGMYGI